MDAPSIYVCAAYAVVLALCMAGAFSVTYDANLAQRIAMGALAVWAAWRIQLVYEYGWGYPHETFVATALLLYAAGSAYKTLKWGIKRRKARNCGGPRRRAEDLQ